LFQHANLAGREEQFSRTDLANGRLFTLLKNVQPEAPKTIVSYVAAVPKPRIVNLEIVPQGQKHFSIGSHTHKAHSTQSR
jgi:hypothetical protein